MKLSKIIFNILLSIFFEILLSLITLHFNKTSPGNTYPESMRWCLLTKNYFKILLLLCTKNTFIEIETFFNVKRVESGRKKSLHK